MSELSPLIDRTPEGFRSQYIVAVRGGHPTHMWTLADDNGAVHIHAWKSSTPSIGREWYGGIEIHSPKRLYGNEPSEPSHKHCWLIEGPCWHDGSSLYFSEYLACELEREDDHGVMPESTHNHMIGALLRWHRDKFSAQEVENQA